MHGILIYSAWQGFTKVPYKRAAGSVNVPLDMGIQKIKINLRFRAVWSESPLGVSCVKDAKFLHVDNEDCEDAQADLALRWAHISKGNFFNVAAQLIRHHENKPI